MDKATKAIAQRVTQLEKSLHRLIDDAPWKQHKQPTDDQTTPSQEDDGANRYVSSISEVNPPPLKAAKAKYVLQHAIPWWRIFEGIGIFAGIGYALITYLQWRDLRHNFEVDQRCWIKTGFVRPELSRSIFQAATTTTNFGKSTALTLDIELTIEIVPAASAPSLKPPFHEHLHIGTLFPGDHIEFPAFLMSGDNRRALTDTEIQSLIDGHTYLSVFGYSIYTDQFGKHWGRFCSWWSFSGLPNTAYANDCVQWNSVGDGDGAPPQ